MTAKRAVGVALVTVAAVFGLSVLAAVDVAPKLFHAYYLPSVSMQPTLLAGDYFFVEPFTASGPARGDIVAMRSPLDANETYIKRIVGVGGDRIRIRDKMLIRNGAPVAEPYVIHVSSYIDNFRDNFPAQPEVALASNWVNELARDTVDGELVIPPGKYFVLGDNRDDSADSRYFGYLDRAGLYGKPVMIYYSVDPNNRAHIRWNRMFRRL